MEKLSNKLASLQPRERRLLFLMIGIFTVLIGFVVVMEVVAAFQERADEIEEFRGAIVHLRKSEARYALNKKKSEKLRSKLENADPSASGAINSLATSLEFDVNVNPKDPGPATTKGKTGAIKQDIEVSIPSVERQKFVDFLNQLDAMDEPLYIRKIDIRRTGRANSSATPLSIQLTLSAYRLESAP